MNDNFNVLHYLGPGRISLSHAPFDSDSPLDDGQFFSDGKKVSRCFGKKNNSLFHRYLINANIHRFNNGS